MLNPFLAQPWHQRILVRLIIATFVFLTWETISFRSVAAALPPGWEVTGFGRGRAATDQTVEFDANRWYVKTGPSRSAIVHQSLSGDLTLTAKFLEASGPNTARIGLMMWATVSPTAGNLGLVLDPQGQKLTLLWDETSTRAQISTDSIQLDGIGFPVWLRVTKSGSYFHAAYSKDGADWRPVGLPVKTFWAGNRPEVFAGLYAEGACEQRVSDLKITPDGAVAENELPAGWSSEVRGQPNFIGGVEHEQGKWTLQGAATRGRGGYHNVTALQDITNRTQLTAQVRLADLADPRAGAGLLFTAHGMDAGVMVFPAGGQLRFFTRRTADGRLLQNRRLPLPASMVGQAEAYLRLAVVEGRVAAFHRAGPDDWVPIGEVLTVTELADDVRGGLELFSESAARTTLKVDFADVEIAPIAALPIQTAPLPTTTSVAASRPAPRAAVGSAPTTAVPRYNPPARSSSSVGTWLGVLFKALFWLTIIAAALVIRPFNRLVRLRNHMRKGWAQIDVQLKRRHDLIQNFVETVRGYAKHEQATLEGVTQARAAAMSAHTPSESARAEEKLNRTMHSLYAVVEGYPELKANQNFLALQQNLTSTEDKIATARHAYNEEVVNYNTAVESFPTNVVAGIFRFKVGDFFELKLESEREVTRATL